MSCRDDNGGIPSRHWLGCVAPAARQFQRRWGRLAVGLFGLFCALLILSGCSTDTHLTFLNPQGPIAAAERWHFWVVMLVLVVFVAVPVFVLTPLIAWRYRYGAKKPRYTPKWKAFLPLEIMTWTGPVVIVIALGYLVWDSTHRLDPYKPLASNQPALRIQVIGYDWKWLFIYPDQGIASVGVMPLPVGKPVAMQLTSATVMQSLQIPALVGQIYAMGGMVTQLHFKASTPGRSLGENTMYNGNGFHQQKFTAVAMTPDEFKGWVRQVRAGGAPLNAHTYKLLSQRTTKAQLAAALPQAKSQDGNVYLKGVSPDLFSIVVKATMNGSPVSPITLGYAPMSPAMTRQPDMLPAEKKQ